MSGGRSQAARLGVSLGAFALVLLVAEAVARATWTTPWYEELEREVVDTGKRLPRHLVGDREFFLRHAPPPDPKPEGEYRILFLGDSFTYGMGVTEEETFVELARATLAERAPVPGVERYVAYNAGVPGSYTNQWLTLFRHVDPAWDPDLVVAVFFLRDGVAGITAHGQITEVGEEMARLKESSPLFRWSYLWRRLASDRAQQELSRTYLAKLDAGYFGTEAETGEWRTARRVLRTLRDEAHASDAAFAIVVFPMLFELDGDYPLQRVVDAIERYSRSLEVPTLSLLPAYLGRDAAPLWLAPWDQHPNAEGHHIAADPLADFLEEVMRQRNGR